MFGLVWFGNGKNIDIWFKVGFVVVKLKRFGFELVWYW